eukprot:gene16706-25644_t
MPFNAYVVDCIRTAHGKKKGALKDCHPADMGAFVIDELLRRTGVPGKAVDDVILNCSTQIGCQHLLGRVTVMASQLLPEDVAGTMVDRKQQAIHFAAQAVMSGDQDVVIACGVESMSKVPVGSAMAGMKYSTPFHSEGLQRKYNAAGAGLKVWNQFDNAELIAKTYEITRTELDAFAARSHRKAAAAQASGTTRREIVAMPIARPGAGGPSVFDRDECVRPATTESALHALLPLHPGGVVTAATSSQASDGASACLIVNEVALYKYNLKPRARIVSMAAVGSNPLLGLDGPIAASRKALHKAGLRVADIDVFEVNEAFACVPLAFEKSLGVDPEKVNIFGGACAIGHPLGSAGTRLLTTLVNALETTNGRYGLQAVPDEATGNAFVIERVTD